MSKVQEARLLPCPFCGGADVTVTRTKNETDYLIHRCKVMGPVSFESFSNGGALEVWNSRAPNLYAQHAERLAEAGEALASEATKSVEYSDWPELHECVDKLREAAAAYRALKAEVEEGSRG